MASPLQCAPSARREPEHAVIATSWVRCPYCVYSASEETKAQGV